MLRFPSVILLRQLGRVALAVCVNVTFAVADDVSPKSNERQLPTAMHSEMSERPTITVGRIGTDVIGADNRALQAAVDYVANLGGGIVEIGEGEYLMRDSLHLRSNVTVRGSKGKTILRKADAAVSRLTLDGDFGEQQITVADASGFTVGAGVAIWDDKAQGFHTTVARITGRRGNTFSIDAPLDGRLHGRGPRDRGHRLSSGERREGAGARELKISSSKEIKLPTHYSMAAAAPEST